MKKLFLAMVMAVISAIAVSAQENGKENTMEVLPVQTDKNDGKAVEQVTVTKNGKERIAIDPGAEFFSDEIEWSVKAGEDILLFIYIKDRQPVQCATAMWSTKCCRTLALIEMSRFCAPRAEMRLKAL